jgi:mono/diheme cytochrome c family protein
MKILAAILALAALCSAQTNSSDPANGKRLFLRNGCYQCHGYGGQGGLAGPRLAQTKLTVAGFTAFVRNPPPSGMPPYRTQVMTDRELADVWAYIRTFPEPTPVKDIPLLNQ